MVAHNPPNYYRTGVLLLTPDGVRLPRTKSPPLRQGGVGRGEEEGEESWRWWRHARSTVGGEGSVSWPRPLPHPFVRRLREPRRRMVGAEDVWCRVSARRSAPGSISVDCSVRPKG